jgi:four helix bundle protein
MAQDYQLEERTFRFAKDTLLLCKSLKQDSISSPLISQIVRSCTSIGANYQEANGASSRKDFQNKIYICKKESQETKHWLKLLKVLYPERSVELLTLYDECQQFVMIFQKITTTMKNSTLKTH